MRFKFDKAKSDLLRNNPKRGIGFEEAREIWRHPYYEDQRSDVPEQYRAIGWVNGKLYLAQGCINLSAAISGATWNCLFHHMDA